MARLHKTILTTLLLLPFVLLFVGPTQAAENELVVLRLSGTINSVTAGYIDRGIGAAESSGARAVVIELDTPGGLDSAMRSMVQRINSSKVPVVVYVSPAGARAASAGTFITMAAHVAAMAPNTAIGAAHPVTGSGQDIPGSLGEKVLNDAAAYIRGIAELRGRNADWAEKAVRESLSLNEREAVDQKVVDLVATDLPNLVAQLEGRQVKLLNQTVILGTQGAPIRRLDTSLMEKFLYAISQPTIAYILLALAMTGLFFELANPGSIFPGVLGGMFLLMALYSLGTLPVNWAGVLLIVLAFVLFVADLFVTAHGALTVGGLISLVAGSLILMSGSNPLFVIDRWVIALVALTVTAFFAFVVASVVQAHRRPTTTGAEALVGKEAVARTALDPSGMVFVEGERWTAQSLSGRVEEGEVVIITEVVGMKLKVVKGGGK